jgi:hypothetical protein
MKFFTVYEIVNSIFLSAISGILFGGIYCASESILIFLKEMILVIPNALKLLVAGSFKNMVNCAKKRKNISLSNIERNIFEAVLFFAFGITLILISYLALDGCMRLYTFIVTVIFFLFARKYIGKIFSSVFKRIFGATYFITLLLISFLFLPIYKAFNKLGPPLKKLVSPIVSLIRKKQSSRIIRSKLKEIRKVMNLNS